MKVIRAKRAGACYGVQRALDMANEVIAAGGRACTLGPLIHNPKVVDDLARRGARAVDDLDDLDDVCAPAASVRPADAPSAGAETVAEDAAAGEAGGAPEEPCAVIIRSHGVTPEVLAQVEARGLRTVDATCPHVARAQAAAAELARAGCRVIVLGEAGHPEVEGLTAWARNAGGKVDVVASVDDIPSGLYDPVGVVVQTTQKRANLDAVTAALRTQGLDPIVKNTICAATSQRQEAAAELAARVDAMVVIGGRNSSNTTRLAEICAAACPRALHIESVEELDAASFAGCATVGVTAGASTPEDQIQAVVTFLEAL